MKVIREYPMWSSTTEITDVPLGAVVLGVYQEDKWDIAKLLLQCDPDEPVRTTRKVALLQGAIFDTASLAKQTGGVVGPYRYVGTFCQPVPGNLVHLYLENEKNEFVQVPDL